MDELPPLSIRFDNSYARLPDRFFARVDPTPVQAPLLIRLNAALAAELGLDAEALSAPAGVLALSGNRPPPGSEPIAQAYAGHQFGGWSPQLGDGRAILLGEVVDAKGRRRDIQLKGSGRTPWSRMGDGRAPLGPVLREYIVSEAMQALGVPTTRSLAAVATGEAVWRESGPLPGGVLTRVAASHVRVGTFQYFSARKDEEALKALVDHVIARHWPEAGDAAGLLRAVCAAQAELVAKWMGLGFIHGVMNTDNMTISGETIDYGPCAFMEGFEPDKTFSFIDEYGRYAYRNQPGIAHWNLSRLAVALIPLLGPDEESAVETARDALAAFPDLYDAAWRRILAAKTATAEGADLGLRFIGLMAETRADFTLAFRRLAEAAEGDEGPLWEVLSRSEGLGPWLADWRASLAGREPAEVAAALRAANPVYIPRNHLVEAAIQAGYAGDYAPYHRLVDVLAEPFAERPGLDAFAAPAAPGEVVERTFCGT